MFERVLSILLEFKNYMAIAAVTALVISGIYLLAVRMFRWNRKSIRIFGIFFCLGKRGSLAVSLLYLRWMYVLVCLIDMTDIKAIHMIYLGLLGIFAGLTVSGIMGLLRETVNGSLLVAGLLVGNLLVSYMREIQFEWSIMAVYVLLGIFMMLYCLYFMIRDMRTISQGRRKTDVQI